MTFRLGRCSWWVCGAVWTVLLGMASTVHADATGRWVRSDGVFFDVVQTGSSLTFSGTNLSLEGMREPSGHVILDGTVGPGACYAILDGVLSSDDHYLSGGVLLGPPCSVGARVPFTAQRCECYDGNTQNGDGCDATCQIEPCYTCTPEPSTCTPSAEGAPCDDGLVCTSGETCSAGSCGGGAPISPCFNLNGFWFRTVEHPFFGVFQYPVEFVQRGSYLELHEPPGSGHAIEVGNIDPFTGHFELLTLRQVLFSLPEQCDGPLTYEPPITTASVAADGKTSDGVIVGKFLPDCTVEEIMVHAERTCGGGSLDPGEECDDGNESPGDGCDSLCQVEACHACTGEPSDCSPVPGSCNDGDACTTGDICSNGGCAGTAIDCGLCLTCAAGECVSAVATGCHDAGKSVLVIDKGRTDDRSTLRWKSRLGDAATADLDDPTSGNDYALCLYDDSAVDPELLFRAAIPSGGSWESLAGGGFHYRDPSLDPDGVLSVVLSARSAPGKARIVVNGEGANLSSRPFSLPSPVLPLPLTLQLQSEGGSCFESRFTQAVTNSEPRGRFKARGVAAP